MRILLSIKAVLNYLYNHLIDLIWTKKIRFADGTEMTTVPTGNNLYDIKILSQAIADKGFAFMCHTTRRDLPKTEVPTLYEDILNKFKSADLQNIGIQTLSGSPFGYNCGGFHGDYFYCIRLDSNDNHWKLFRCHTNNLSSPVWELVYFNEDNKEDIEFCVNKEFNFYCTDEYIVLGGVNFDHYDGHGNSSKLVIIDYEGNLLLKRYFDEGTMTMDCALSVTEETDGQYVFFSTGYRDIGVYKLYKWKVEEDNINISQIATTSTYITNISKHGNYYYFIYANRTDNSTLARTENWQSYEYLCRCGGSYGVIGNTIITERSNVNGKISFDGGQTFSDTNWSNSYARYTKFNGKDKYICVKVDTTSIYTTTDFINYEYIGNSDYFQNFAFNYDNLFFVLMDSYNINYSGFTQVIYTDTYTINGTSVTINYCKCNDFKICLSDNGGTNDTNLEKVLNYLGYLNYWLLDLTNETITIQRNKQPFTLMYIGDDFIDDFDDLPTISTRSFPQAEVIDISSASVSLNVKSNKDYKLSNNEITDITISSVENSINETTIQFTTGNSAPTLIDNSGITWIDGSVPVLQANYNYIILIWDSKALIRQY